MNSRIATFLNFLKKKKKSKTKNGANGKKGKVSRPYFWQAVIFGIVVLLISLMMPRGKSYKYTSLKEGEVYVGEEIIAPFTFAINKTDDEYKNDIRRAEEAVLQVFSKNDSIANWMSNQLTNFFDSLAVFSKVSPQTTALSKELTRLLQIYNVSSSDEILVGLIEEFKNQTISEFEKNLKRIFRDISAVGILDRPKESIKLVDNKILIISGVEEIITDINSLYDLKEVEVAQLEKLRTAFESEDLRVKIGYEILKVFLKPNIIYDKAETNRKIIEARNNVPIAKGTVLANERIIDRYERVTRDHLAKLNSLAVELAERETGKSLPLSVLRFVSKMLLIGLILSIFIVFLMFNREKILKDVKRITLIAIIFLIVSFLAFNISNFELSSYLIPITIGSMLLTIFFDTRVGFVGTIVLAVIIGCLRGNDFNISVVSLIVGTISVMSVYRIRTRSWLVNSILIVIASYIVSITIIEVLHYTPFKLVLRSWMFGAINGFVSPLLAYGLQVLFENMFDIVTDMRLLELSDLNSPILRKLSFRAPGTYHHSLMVGNLTETAAESIGANSLLARVGAYYHDIGKIEKPEYFIENQGKNRNPHEKLSPSMSCLILTNHVRRGLELAKKYKLPREIRDFIAEHHGTNKMEYFFQKALEKKITEDEINESNFRYPGPKPGTKETGIVMLADAIEAASRALREPSASRIRGMVISIVQDRFKESELDECPLTLRDLTKIIESFETYLLATFHGRVEYPDQEEKLTPVKEKKVKEKNVGA
ncbi:MAG TPA: HDIG domain-containing protein [bacterium]|nr:HDIG domain-containing protein [bacterium]